MSSKMTISCEVNLAEVELEEGLCVLVQDTGKIFHCIAGYDGRLTWSAEASTRYDCPEPQLQLQESVAEPSVVQPKKSWVKPGKARAHTLH